MYIKKNINNNKINKTTIPEVLHTYFFFFFFEHVTLKLKHTYS